MLTTYDDEADILDFLHRQRALLEERMRQYREVVGSLDRIIQKEREARMAVQTSTFEVEEKALDTLLIAGVRMRGCYSECGKGFAKIGKALGRYISGKCFLLHYDTEYKEDEADFEACMPVRKGKAVDGISVRDLPGGRCVALLHKGPYEELGRSYAKILAYIKDKGYEVALPTREVYLKGPGMIFKGNPKNYLTEIQMLVKDRQGS
jgi:effector-binding domain-containing protein